VYAAAQPKQVRFVCPDCCFLDCTCECEHNSPDSLDARVFPSVVIAVAPVVTMDEASSILCCS